LAVHGLVDNLQLLAVSYGMATLSSYWTCAITGYRVLQGDLVQLVADLMFGAATNALFGPAFAARHGMAALQRAFSTFEAGFEVR
jgi:phage tail protein X